MTDFRSDPMPSAEGRGRARAAWDAYAQATHKLFGPVLDPLLEPLAKSYSASAVIDSLGFWLVWQLHGGFEGLHQLGMSRASIFRRVATFRKLFKVHPDEFTLSGVDLDVGTYLGTDVTKGDAGDEGEKRN